MNSGQEHAKARLQEQLRKRRKCHEPLPDRGESRGYFFTEVEQVTVIIGPDGGYILPSVRTYAAEKGETALDAAVYADAEFKKNLRGRFKTGHSNGIINSVDWSCGSRDCPCADESFEQRFLRAIRR
jgi:hypothetical protein